LLNKWGAHHFNNGQEQANSCLPNGSTSNQILEFSWTECYSFIIFLHGFAKNEKSNLSPKELAAFRRLAEILLALETEQIEKAIAQGIFIEVKS
jgi:hypothetical protein